MLSSLSTLPLCMYLADLCNGICVFLVLIAIILWCTIAAALAMTFIVQDDDDRVRFRRIVRRWSVGAVLLTLLAIAIPGKSVMYVYFGTKYAEALEKNEFVASEAKEIYSEVKSILHDYAVESRKGSKGHTDE